MEANTPLETPQRHDAQRILLLARHQAGAEAFRTAYAAMGHLVIAAGPGQGAVGGVELAPDAALSDLSEALAENEMRPDLAVFLDDEAAPAFRPRGLNRLECPTVAYFPGARLDGVDTLGADHVAVSRPEQQQALQSRGVAAIVVSGADAPQALLAHAQTQPSRGLALWEGHRLFAAGDVDAAVMAFSQATRSATVSPEALNNLGACMYAAGRHAEAIELFRGALAADPAHKAARENLNALVSATAIAPAQAAAERPQNPLDKPVPPYYAYVRPEIQRMVPMSASRVLDVGCAAGALGASLKRERPGTEVVGVEYDRIAAVHAAKQLDAVFQGSVDALNDFPYPHGYFDCMVFADVLEHLPDPEATLTRLLPYLREGGHLVISLPNVRHYEVVGDLFINGRFTYQDAGILDRTHLRFYTYQEIQAMLERLGLGIQALDVNRGVPNPAAFEQMAHVVGMLGGDADAFRQEGSVIQYIVRVEKPSAVRPTEPVTQTRAIATPQRAGEPPVASLVMLTLNQLDYTKLCVESIFQYSTVPFELIIVDNGSSDGTRSYLRQLAAAHPEVQLVFNDQNMGFAHGCNQGILRAAGEVVVLINNDTVVTEGWLEGLIAPMLQDPAIGAVGPVTNQTVGPQRLPFVPYGADMAAMQRFARELKATHRGEAMILNRAIGFCVAVRRAVLERIGGLDTRFGKGNFEDDDLSLRIQTAGYRICIVQDVFIHHFGHKTFIGERVDYSALMQENWLKFAAKWGIDEPYGQGYPGHELARLPWNPARDVFPLELPEGPRAPIDDARGHHFLATPDWRDPASLAACVEAIRGFNEAFGAADDVALLLWVNPDGPDSTEGVAERLGAALAEAGLDGDDTPALVLFDAPGNPITVASMHRAAQTFLPLGRPDDAARAARCGLDCLETVTATGFRSALAAGAQPVA